MAGRGGRAAWSRGPWRVVTAGRKACRSRWCLRLGIAHRRRSRPRVAVAVTVISRRRGDNALRASVDAVDGPADVHVAGRIAALHEAGRTAALRQITGAGRRRPHRSMSDRLKRRNGIPSNRDRAIARANRGPVQTAAAPIDRHNRVGLIPAACHAYRCRWYGSAAGPLRRKVPVWRIVNVEGIAAAAPPGTMAKAGCPAPADTAVIAPRAVGIRHESPRFAARPDVSVTRSPHPASCAVGISVTALRLIRRPNIALAGDVVPVAVCIEVAPRGVIAVRHGAGGGGLLRLLRGEGLIAVRVPGVPGIRLDGIGDGVVARHLGAQLEALRRHAHRRPWSLRR